MTSKFKIYTQAANFLLEKYAPKNVIAETESGTLCIAEQSNMKPSHYCKGVVTKIVRCEDVYEKYALHAIFV